MVWGIRGEEEFSFIVAPVVVNAGVRCPRVFAATDLFGQRRTPQSMARARISRGAAAGYRYFPPSLTLEEDTTYDGTYMCTTVKAHLLFFSFLFFALFFSLFFFLWSGGGGGTRTRREREKNSKKKRREREEEKKEN